MSQANSSEARPDADAVARLSQALNLENCEDRFMSSDLSLLETGNFSDVELVCGDRSWSVHKSIICKRCTWFEKALTGDFEEAATNKITITSFSPELVDAVVRYLYSGALDTNIVNKCEGDSIISKFVRLWSAADFFLLGTLQKDIITAFEDRLEHHIKIMNRAKPDPAKDVKDAIVEEFFSGVDTAYLVFPHAKPCQRVLVDFAHAIRMGIYLHRGFVDSISRYPSLASDLFLVAVRGNQSKWAGSSQPDLRCFMMYQSCMECKRDHWEALEMHADPLAVGDKVGVNHVHWKCDRCVEKSGHPWESRVSAQAAK